MSSYDPSLFERTREGFVISQRFRRITRKIVGPINVFLQMATQNFFLRAIPRPLAYVFLFLYFSLVSGLCLLILRQLSSYNSQRQQYDDVDLLEMIIHRQRYTRQIGRGHILHIIFVVLNLVIFFATWNESLHRDFLTGHFLILLYSAFFYGLYSLIRSRLWNDL